MTETIHGADVLREAAGFLTGMVVSHQRSGFAKGEHALVQVSPDFDEAGRFSLLITCQARGRQRVDWHRLALWARRNDGEALQLTPRICAFDTRGQAWLKDLTQGSHQLTAATCAKVTDLVRGTRLADAASGADAAGGGAATIPFRVPGEIRTIPVYLALDGSINATVRPLTGEIQVVFETDKTDPA